MKLTVFTSCWNQGELLGKSIESVLSQTYENFEYLVYDDGSTDNTREVLESYHDPRIRKWCLPKQPNVGCVINRSLDDMEGEVWVWCPSDDLLLPNLLETKLEESARQDHRAVIYSDFFVLDQATGYTTQTVLEHVTPQDFAKLIWHSCPIGMTGIWIPRSVISLVGKFPEHLVCSEDYYWVLKAVSEGVPFIHIPEPLYQKFHHANRNTARMDPIVIQQTVRSIREELW